MGERGVPILKKMVKEKKISSRIVPAFDYESLSSEYGWTPKEIDEMDSETLEIYKAIKRGRSKGVPRKVKKLVR